MEVIPAIDVRAGRCVRLVQGDYARETVFAQDPAEVALRWEAAGAPRIHVVDLDGAREGRPVNEAVIRRILSQVRVPVQVGGGIRNIATVRQYLELGADRVILGTAAIEDPELLAQALALSQEAIVVGVDARGGLAVTQGWLRASDVTPAVLVRRLSEAGVGRVVYTDVSRDGMLAGPDFEGIAGLLAEVQGLPAPVKVIASGGVATVDHIRRLAALGVEGVIVGKALYTGTLGLQEAIGAALP
jgi:phosphoribosylformimino-5-aminoimidazole carboxamide ribotide isomerase